MCDALLKCVAFLFMPPTKFDPSKHQRRSIRLRGYDYNVGAYFVTIVAYRRECLFGEIKNGEMRLNDFGKIADECWCAIPEHFPNAKLGVYVIMPNHVHGVIVIGDDVDDGGRGAAMLRPYDDNTTHKINVKPGSLGAIVRSYKSVVSYRINKEYNTTGIWQRNYYEHIIRNADEANRIHLYIESNPSQWDNDDENPSVNRR